jgi:hypothetical protein
MRAVSRHRRTNIYNSICINDDARGAGRVGFSPPWSIAVGSRPGRGIAIDSPTRSEIPRIGGKPALRCRRRFHRAPLIRQDRPCRPSRRTAISAAHP